MLNADNIIALVYREHPRAKCNQYAFTSLLELHAWCHRWPYRRERIHIIALRDRRKISERILPSIEAPDWLRWQLASKPPAPLRLVPDPF